MLNYVFEEVPEDGTKTITGRPQDIYFIVHGYTEDAFNPDDAYENGEPNRGKKSLPLTFFDFILKHNFLYV